VDAGGRQGRDFAPERTAGNVNVFQVAADHLKALQGAGKRVLVASWTDGSAERMGGVLSDHGLTAIRRIANWPEALKLHPSATGLACLGIERGFEAPDFALMSGHRHASAGRRISWPKRRPWRPAIWSPISNMAWAAIWA
jgi:transcription-repair coupling factor (superfamily II helicase)